MIGVDGAILDGGTGNASRPTSRAEREVGAGGQAAGNPGGAGGGPGGESEDEGEARAKRLGALAVVADSGSGGRGLHFSAISQQ